MSLARAALSIVALASACSDPTTNAEYEGPSPTPLAVTFGANPPPAADGTIARDARLVVTFDDYPDPDAIGFGPVLLRSGTVNFDNALAFDLPARSLIVTPRALLAAGISYELVLDGSVAALSGRTTGSISAHTYTAGADSAGPSPAPPAADWCEVRQLLAGCQGGCHTSGNPQRSLDLDAEADPYDARLGIIGVPSVGLAGTPYPLLRVAPGDSARSALLRKLLDGTLRVDGARMPLGLPALPQADIVKLQQWIDQGAPTRACAE